MSPTQNGEANEPAERGQLSIAAAPEGALRPDAAQDDTRPSTRRLVLTVGVIAASVAISLSTISDPLLARGAAIAATYLTLALTEVVPPFVPTLLLLAATPLALAPLAPRFALAEVLTWPADPVVALFAGGLSLGAAGHRHRIDAAIASFIVSLARGGSRRLLALVILGTAVMSMWMSNIAAAAMILSVLRPLLQHPSIRPDFRRALLLGVAMAANVGGIATPIGTGPNAIAIAAVAPRFTITFLHWMLFALPLALGLLAVAFVLLLLRYRVDGSFTAAPSPVALDRRSFGVVGVFTVSVLTWVSEPLHGLSAPLVALLATLGLFASGLLGRRDLNALDWSTLGLIAGGISLGRLLEATGATAAFAVVDWTALPPMVWLGLLVAASAGLSALMSNTGTAALLIPLASTVDASASTAVIIAIAASFGMPFSISTPPNAMAYGEGGLRSADLLFIGLALMLFGCVLVTLTGGAVLHLLGVP